MNWIKEQYYMWRARRFISKMDRRILECQEAQDKLLVMLDKYNLWIKG